MGHRIFEICMDISRKTNCDVFFSNLDALFFMLYLNLRKICSPFRLSSYGANQLCFDFNSFRDWVTRLEPQYLHSDAMSAILADNTFDEFRSVIKLLCCQPESRRRSNPGSVSDTDGASSIGSTTSNGKYFETAFDAFM